MQSISATRSTVSALVTDNKLKEALTTLEKDSSSYAGLLDTIDRYRRSVADVGDAYESDSWKYLEPKHFPDGIHVVHELLRSLASDLHGIRYMIVFDCDQLLELINTGLATRSFRQAALGARALLERAAITEGHFSSLRGLFQSVTAFPARKFARGRFSQKDVLEHLVPRVSAAQALRRYTAAGSFNWDIFDDPNSVAAGANIAMNRADLKKQLTAGKEVKKLTWTGSHPVGTNLYWWYSFICDFVHPNYGTL